MKTPKRSWPGGMPRRNDGNYDRQLRKHSKRDTLPERLMLVHTTSAWHANEIVKNGKFEVRPCDVFGRNLLYFFVLRPAYRLKDGNVSSDQLTRFPITFIISAAAFETPLHVYPFDTGAGARGLYERFDPNIPLEDYELDPSHEAAAGHIEWAFETLEAYFTGSLKHGLIDGLPYQEWVTRGFISIAEMGRERSNQFCDLRAATVEVTTDRDLALFKHVQLVILPKQFLEGDTTLVDKLKALDIEWLPYNWLPNRTPDEFQAEISRHAENWYREKGILKT